MARTTIPEEDIIVPVYLITGFLESGKTTFLDFTAQQDYFDIPGQTILLVGEEGEVEYDDEGLRLHVTKRINIGEQENFTKEFLDQIEKEYKPHRVLLEYNPLWGVDKLYEMEMPNGWGIVQHIVTVDASTFQMYMNNMKSLFVEMSRDADMIMFNRSSKDLPLANFRRSIKVVNPSCEVLFEDAKGEMTDIFEDDVPYDLDADIIEIDDIDYGIFYMDLMEKPHHYKGKTVRFKGKVLKNDDPNSQYFMPGRLAMTCCADDTSYIGYACQSKNTPMLQQGSWVEVTAVVDWKKIPGIYREHGPVFIAKSIKSTAAPKVEMVYFT